MFDYYKSDQEKARGYGVMICFVLLMSIIINVLIKSTEWFYSEKLGRLGLWQIIILTPILSYLIMKYVFRLCLYIKARRSQ